MPSMTGPGGQTAKRILDRLDHICEILFGEIDNENLIAAATSRHCEW